MKRTDRLTARQTDVFLAVLTLPHPTIPAIAAHCGIARSTVHFHLDHLREIELVTWEQDHRGTLRPLLGEVA